MTQSPTSSTDCVTQCVVFVPGLNNSSSVWREVIANLPPKLTGLAVDCLPLPSIDAIARRLLEDLPRTFVAVGHSFGGYVVQAMLAQQPDRLVGVVLVNTSDDADTPDQAAGRRAKAADALAGDYEQMAMGRVDLVYHPDHVSDQRLLDERLAGVREYGVERYAAHLSACADRPNRSALLAGAEVPLLVVSADQDLVVPTAAQSEMAHRIGAQLRVIGPAGHMLPAEQPKALAHEIADWLVLD